jgi:hypothetical protein
MARRTLLTSAAVLLPATTSRADRWQPQGEVSHLQREIERGSLKGLPLISFASGWQYTEFAEDGLPTRQELNRKSELILRTNRVPFLPVLLGTPKEVWTDELKKVEGKKYGYLKAELRYVKNSRSPQFSYYIGLMATELVELKRTGTFAYATLWHRDAFGIAGDLVSRDIILSKVESLMEDFANDWLTVNPAK